MKLAEVQAEYREVLEEMDASALAVLRLGRELLIADESRQLMNKGVTDILSSIAFMMAGVRDGIVTLQEAVESGAFLWSGAEIDDA